MSRRGWALLALVSVLGLLLPALSFDLRLPDEPRVAHTSLEILRTGDLLVPSVNGEPFLQAPPLHYWLLALWQALAGLEPDGLARVPSVVLSLGTILLTALAAGRLGGGRAALLSALVLAGTIGFWDGGQRAVVDASLAFFVSLALYPAARALAGEGSPVLLGVWTGAALAGALLAKGLPGPVIVLSALVLPLVLCKAVWRRSLGAWALAALATFALLASPYVILLGLRDPSYPAELFLEHVSARALDAAHHDTPNIHFLHRSLLKLLPWGALLPFAIVRACRSLRGTAARDSRTAVARALHLSWLILPFVLLLLSRSKRNIYLLPIFPAAALLAGDWLARFGTGGRRARIVLTAAWVGAIVLPILGSAYSAFLERDASLVRMGRRLLDCERDGAAVLGIGLEEREAAALAWYLRHPFPNEVDRAAWAERVKRAGGKGVIVGEARDIESVFESAGLDPASRTLLDHQPLRRRRLEAWSLTAGK